MAQHHLVLLLSATPFSTSFFMHVYLGFDNYITQHESFTHTRVKTFADKNLQSSYLTCLHDCYYLTPLAATTVHWLVRVYSTLEALFALTCSLSHHLLTQSALLRSDAHIIKATLSIETFLRHKTTPTRRKDAPITTTVSKP